MHSNCFFQLGYLSTFLISLSAPNTKKTIKIKNFIIYLLFLKYIFKVFNNVKLSFFFVRKKKIIFVTTKAPYKNKLTRNHYTKKCFYYAIILNFNYCLPSVNFYNISKIPLYSFLFRLEISFLMVYIIKIRLCYNYKLKLFFLNAHNSI